jgi:hypothetical protein
VRALMRAPVFFRSEKAGLQAGRTGALLQAACYAELATRASRREALWRCLLPSRLLRLHTPKKARRRTSPRGTQGTRIIHERFACRPTLQPTHLLGFDAIHRSSRAQITLSLQKKVPRSWWCDFLPLGGNEFPKLPSGRGVSNGHVMSLKNGLDDTLRATSGETERV